MKRNKLKKRILGVFLIFLLGFIFYFTVDSGNLVVEAASKKKTCTDNMYGDDAISLMFSNDSNKSENIYQVTSKQGKFQLVSISEDIGSDSNGNYIITNDSIASASDWLTYDNDVVTPKKPAYFTVNKAKFNDEDAAGKNVVLTFKLIGDSSCSGAKKLDVEMYTSFSMTNIVAKYDQSTGIKLPANKWYNSLCGILRGTKSFSDFSAADLTVRNDSGVITQQLTASDYANYDNSSNALAYYTASFPYCFRENVSKNLKKKTVIKNIKQTLNRYKSISQIIGEPEYSEEFNTKFNQAKYRAGGIIDSDGSNDAVGCRTTAQLKAGQQPNSCFTAKTTILDDSDSDSNVLNVPTLKCDSNSTAEYRDENGYNFENLKSYYAYSTNSVFANYTYHKTGKNWDSTNDRTTLENADDPVTKEVCKQTCEEAVDVEYGPPVASKAGLCFEYRVKVTSRIKCKSVLNPEGLPDVKEEACAPAPVCHHTSRKVLSTREYVGNGGGPNEDYEDCINKCDGGKYTQDCSKKCFNEVYGSTCANELAASYNIQPSQIAKTYNSEFIIKKKGQSQDPWNLDDAYYYVDNNVIRYRGGFALWYYYHTKNRTESSYGIAPGKTTGSGYYYDEGISRASNGGNYICTAECYYVPCGNGYYNQADIDYDIEKNAEEYKSKVTSCAITAKCSTRTAEFTMSTNYNDQSIEFGKSHVNSKEDSTNCEISDIPTLKACQSSSSSDSTTSSRACANSGVLYDYDGCYKSPCNPDTNKYKAGDKFYESEITYPGTWIKAKTQEISFEQQSGDGWYKQNQKFCLPLNTKDVNQKWWTWRMNQKAKNNTYQYDSSSSSSEDKCSISSSTAKNSTFAQYNGGDAQSGLVYNIEANIVKFGKFLWNFNVQCFYATNDSHLGSDSSSGSGENSNSNQCSTTDEKVRSVDLSDLFPNEGKNATETRIPGFNWSKAATISQTKATTLNSTTNYAVDPTVLTEVIESRGDEIFSNDETYLDYKFHLTPDILKNIRTYNADKKYTDFNGKFLTSAEDIKRYGLIVYRSNLFYHPSDAETVNATIPQPNVLAIGNMGCNNDYSGHTAGSVAGTGECEYLGKYNGWGGNLVYE